MRVRKDAWHYRVWRFTHYFRGGKLGEYNNLPEQTNLCRYVNRTILMPIPICVGFGLMVALSVVVLVVGNTLTILSGTGLFLVGDEKDEKGELKPMKYFPLMTFGTRQIPMPAVVLLSYGLLVIAAIVYVYPWTTLMYAGYGAGGLGALALLYVIGAILVDGFRRVGRWDGWLLFRSYLKAKKQGVCPLVTFDEPDHPATAEIGEPKTA